MRTRMLTAALATMLLVPISAAQDSLETGYAGTGVLELETNAPHASVYANDLLLGRARQQFFVLPAGPVALKLVLAGKENWSIPPVETAFALGASDTTRVRLEFPYYYRFESTPYGASVFVSEGNILLGTTPLEITEGTPLVENLVFRLAEYWPEELEPGQDIWNVHAVRMRPISPLAEASQRIAFAEPDTRKKWIDYAALGTAAVAGVVAIHYKFKADRRYDRYRELGDPALRPTIKRYDVYSGVALGVMQAGLGLFAIRLVLR